MTICAGRKRNHDSTKRVYVFIYWIKIIEGQIFESAISDTDGLKPHSILFSFSLKETKPSQVLPGHLATSFLTIVRFADFSVNSQPIFMIFYTHYFEEVRPFNMWKNSETKLMGL